MSTKKKSSDWRDLKKGSPTKGSRRKPISWRARFRAILNWTKIIAIVSTVVAICVGTIYIYKNFYLTDIFGGSGEPISKIELKTDGKINGKWLNNYLKIKRGTKLSDVNIFEVKHSLDMLSQIKSSKVERIFPDILRITISEHRATAKVILRVDYENKLYALSPEGFFFVPVCVTQEELDALKFLDGLNPTFEGSLPAQFKEMPKLIEFINAATTRVPEEFIKWKSIDVSHMNSATLPLLSAINENSIKYIFKVGDYPRQFDRLEYILRYMKENPIESVEKIDLTLSEWSVVKFAKPKKK